MEARPSALRGRMATPSLPTGNYVFPEHFVKINFGKTIATRDEADNSSDVSTLSNESER